MLAVLIVWCAVSLPVALVLGAFIALRDKQVPTS